MVGSWTNKKTSLNRSTTKRWLLYLDRRGNLNPKRYKDCVVVRAIVTSRKRAVRASHYYISSETRPNSLDHQLENIYTYAYRRKPIYRIVINNINISSSEICQCTDCS